MLPKKVGAENWSGNCRHNEVERVNSPKAKVYRKTAACFVDSNGGAIRGTEADGRVVEGSTGLRRRQK